MPRSLRKGVHVQPGVVEKVKRIDATGTGEVIYIYDRSSVVLPELVGHTVAVSNGKGFTMVYVSEGMVGHLFGEFVLTRFFKCHTQNK